MTCLADCAAIRPKSKGGKVSAIQSPTCAAGFFLRASVTVICVSISRAGRGHAETAWRRFGLFLAGVFEFELHASRRHGFGLRGASREAAGPTPRLIGAGILWRGSPHLWFDAASRILRRFGGPQRLADQRLGQNQPRLSNVVERQLGCCCFAGLGVVALEYHHCASAVAYDLTDQTTETFAPADTVIQFDTRFLCQGPAEIRDADERPVDPRRGNFKAIGRFHRIFDIENRRQSRANDLAILDIHQPVRPFRHDLHGRSRLCRKLDPDQPVSKTGQNRLRQMRDARGNPGFLDQARFIQANFIEDALRLYGFVSVIQT